MQNENKSGLPAFDTSGRYESGLKSLVKSLQWAFAILLGLIVLMLIYFFSWGGYFSVEPQQAVIVMRFGRIRDTLTSGGHWYFPYPVHRFIRVQTNQQFLKITFQQSQVNPDEIKDSFEPGLDDYLLTGDANIVLTSWTLGYKITDPAKYYETLATPEKPVVNGRVAEDDEVVDANGFTGRRGPRTLLRNLFRQAVLRVSATSKVDELLATGQARYSEAVQREFTKLLDAADCGITLESVVLDQVLPPAKTKEAFASVTAASTTMSTLRNQAEAYRVETANDALAREAEILAAAATYRTETVSSVKAESSYFKSILKEYNGNPRPVRMALFTSALSGALAEIGEDKFVLSSGGDKRQLWLRLNPEPKRPADPDQQKAEK
jgi:membrane protease subunit HflK